MLVCCDDDCPSVYYAFMARQKNPCARKRKTKRFVMKFVDYGKIVSEYMGRVRSGTNSNVHAKMLPAVR